MKKICFSVASVPTNILAMYVIWKLIECRFQRPKGFWTHCNKNIKIRAEVVMFILVCSIAAFNFSTAHKNVTHSCLKERFVSHVCCNESLSHIRDLKATKCRFQWPKKFCTHCDKNIKIRAEVVMFILACSIAAFNISTAKCNVTLLHKK